MKIYFQIVFLLLSHLCMAQNLFFQKNESASYLSELSHNTGIAVADYDNDGDLDYFIVAKADFNELDPSTWSRLFSNNNDGSFTDVTIESGLFKISDRDIEDPGWGFGVKMGASWGDYDNDGYKDLLLTNYKGVHLFKNFGDGTFNEVTTQAGLPRIDSCYNYTALWWDFNNDSFLDLFLPNWKGCSRNKYFENNGDQSFTEKAEEYNLTGTQFGSLMSVPIDVNNDDRWDLFIANDFGVNELFVQQPDGSFLDKAIEYGVDADGNDMGMAIGDYDNNGVYDYYITNIAENRLFTFNGQDYDNLASGLNVLKTYWAWDARFTDFDLDGDEDLFVLNGYEIDNTSFPGLNQNFYFENQYVQGQINFIDKSVDVGVHESSNSLSMGVFDYDYDGDQDVLMSSTDSKPLFYENRIIDQEADPNKNWLNVHLQGSSSNYDGFGTYVNIWTQGRMQTRLHYGAGFLAQHIQAVHFGLGTNTVIDSIELKWSSGQIDTYYDLNSNVNYKFIEGSNFLELDLGAEKIYGCTDETSCTYNPLATTDDGSCSYLDSPQVVGDTNAHYLESKEYIGSSNSQDTYYKWSVENGQIISGQGTNTIQVKWGLHSIGVVKLVQVEECHSLATEMDVVITMPSNNEFSIARLWNEILLEAIRNDFARPTMHARNLFHTSVAMYDIWALFDDEARSYLIGNEVNGYVSEFDGFESVESKEASVNKAISYAMYRLLNHRFSNSPNIDDTREIINRIFLELGYDAQFFDQDYSTGNPAALGNFVSQTIIDFGLQDGSSETQNYNNQYYHPVNLPLVVNGLEDNVLQDPNRWQPLQFETFIDQSGNTIIGSTPDFLSPEWGNVAPFAMQEDQANKFERDLSEYQVYFDPGNPPKLDALSSTDESDYYKWGFQLVSIWSSHLDSDDEVMWDISPNSIGNLSLSDFPSSFGEYPTFYNLLDGGDPSKGHEFNPVTGQAYEEQMVRRGDYTRVLAEFWADGPDSETPPGHWFVLLNNVSDHPLLEKRLEGNGPILSDLEWDVKSYFLLGGSMHDAAIAAWSIKGWYDYIRPISAIRYMAGKGQSSDPLLPNYHVAGIELIEDFIELVDADDPLAGVNNQNVNKVKLYTWRGHPFISDPEWVDAGVGWILAEDWFPYQRISFVTPPFAGYVSGHSTFSRAAAETMSLLTGDPFFPGGLAEYHASANDFLVFEEGPSQDVILQWATYRDASDQCSLSRIWGGIHPPADDIPGRIIGEKIGVQSFNFGVPYFSSPVANKEVDTTFNLFPNPIYGSGTITLLNTNSAINLELHSADGRKIENLQIDFDSVENQTRISLANLQAGLYFLTSGDRSWKVVVL